jgi:hypothetical protein
MARQPPPISLTAVGPIADRKDTLRRESLRDFAGVAVGVVAGALLWVVVLSLTRLSS